MARSRVPNTEISTGIWAFDFGNTCFRIPVRLHYTLFLFVFIQVFAAGLAFNERNYTLLIFVLYGPILTISVFLVRSFIADTMQNVAPLISRSFTGIIPTFPSLSA